jgi:iron only hydrogenase large subunit-like protein
MVVVSISPQTRASLAAKYNLSLDQTHRKLTWFLKAHMGVDYVFDTAFSRDFSLLESAREFIRRYNAAKADLPQKQFPMLCGVCPGWVCYAEKTHGYVVPFIDTTKSPQQMMGSIVKNYFASKVQIPPQQIFHSTVMPCYDKKLEASRDDFKDASTNAPDVDCVITSGELELMMKEQTIDIKQCSELPIESL